MYENHKEIYIIKAYTAMAGVTDGRAGVPGLIHLRLENETCFSFLHRFNITSVHLFE